MNPAHTWRSWPRLRQLGCGGLLFLCAICAFISLIRPTAPQSESASERPNRINITPLITIYAPTQPVETVTPLPTEYVAASPTLSPLPPTVEASAVATPAPTDTPMTSPSLGPVARVNANVRAGPGLDYPIIGTVLAGTPLVIRARTTAGDWLLLDSGGWIYADLVANVPVVPIANYSSPPLAADESPTTQTPIMAATAPLPVLIPTAVAGTGNNPNAFTCIGGCATPPDPSCAIKGNVNSRGEKIYHMPGQRDYDRTDIKPEEGDRWFCTPEEAQAAGFRAARR